LVDTLAARDRELVVDLVLEHYGAGVMRRAILAERGRGEAIAYARRAFRDIVLAAASPAGEELAVQGLGSRAGLRVTVGDRQGLVRWCEVADQVRHLQLALPL
jgi:hypothetical protein